MTNPLCSAVVNHILNSCEYASAVTLNELKFVGERDGYVVAVSTDFDDSEEGDIDSIREWLVFNIPLSTPHAFVLISDGDPDRVARIVANLEQYERNERPLSENSYIALDDDSYLQAHHKVGALFLPVSDSFHLKSVSSGLSFAGRDIHFLYVVLINEVEKNVLHENGRDALFDLWQECGRGITSVDDGLE